MPKGVVLTHRNLYLHAIHSALTNGLSGDDVILHTISLFHVNGWGTPHYVTGLGGVHVLLPKFDVEYGRIDMYWGARLARTPAETPVSAVIRNSPMSPVRVTWVPPQSSIE